MRVLYIVSGLQTKKNKENPLHGIFIKTQIDSLKKFRY